MQPAPACRGAALAAHCYPAAELSSRWCCACRATGGSRRALPLTDDWQFLAYGSTVRQSACL